MQSMSIHNLGCYRFVPLTDLPQLRSTLRAYCKDLDLKGTILLSPEGINCSLAGSEQSVETFARYFREHFVHETLDASEEKSLFKRTLSTKIPFRRMEVRLKKEIITTGLPTLKATTKGNMLPPIELKTWLDSGKKVLLLDTRNTYEVEAGTFEGAEDLHIDHFRHFANAVGQWHPDQKDTPVVMFCTGGIRCEKASTILTELHGFKEVYQLQGGILKYFEDCGSAHWKGDCFIFDERTLLKPDLSEQTPLPV